MSEPICSNELLDDARRAISNANQKQPRTTPTDPPKKGATVSDDPTKNTAPKRPVK